MRMNLKKISIFIILGFLLFTIYSMISSGKVDKTGLRYVLLLICCGCQILTNFTTTKEVKHLPEEIKNDEDYTLAKDRIRIGAGMAIIGGLMVVVPLVALFVLNELHGLSAEVSVFFFIIGIPLLLIGVVILTLGTSHIDQKVEEVEAAERTVSKKQAIVNKVCNAVSWIALIGVLVLFLI